MVEMSSYNEILSSEKFGQGIFDIAHKSPRISSIEVKIFSKTDFIKSVEGENGKFDISSSKKVIGYFCSIDL
jgi:hypothetical protein